MTSTHRRALTQPSRSRILPPERGDRQQVFLFPAGNLVENGFVSYPRRFSDTRPSWVLVG